MKVAMISKFWVNLPAAIVFMIFCLSGIIFIFWIMGFIVNLTPSMPMGIWRLKKAAAQDLKLQGSVVAFCPPDTLVFQKAQEKGILHAGSCKGSYMPLLKEVAGVPGDIIDYSNGFIINGQRIPNSSIQHFDLIEGQNPISQHFIVPNGFVWLMSSYSALSYDSRYFGIISQKQIVGSADPMFIAY